MRSRIASAVWLSDKIQDSRQLAPQGRVVGIDHSALMIERASRRNLSAIQAGLVDLRVGGLELLRQLGEVFDKVFSVNVLQFLPERTPVLRMIRSVLKPDGVLATTVQPRHLGATAADAQAFAQTLSREMIEAGFREVTIKQLDLKPIPAVCVPNRDLP
jgi:SAM-dependent methyltransferase